MTLLNKPITRKTGTTASHYGRDGSRRLVVSIIPGGSSDDLIELRPERTRRGRGRRITVTDLWSHMQRCEANKAWGERMAAKKKAKAEKLERARLLRSIRSTKGNQ